jgi:hypothetical protein
MFSYWRCPFRSALLLSFAGSSILLAGIRLLRTEAVDLHILQQVMAAPKLFLI